PHHATCHHEEPQKSPQAPTSHLLAKIKLESDIHANNALNKCLLQLANKLVLVEVDSAGSETLLKHNAHLRSGPQMRKQLETCK
nr:hypothetical protein [Candidatus Njordarchaeum guaymaensis]